MPHIPNSLPPSTPMPFNVAPFDTTPAPPPPGPGAAIASGMALAGGLTFIAGGMLTRAGLPNPPGWARCIPLTARQCALLGSGLNSVSSALYFGATVSSAAAGMDGSATHMHALEATAISAIAAIGTGGLAVYGFLKAPPAEAPAEAEAQAPATEGQPSTSASAPSSQADGHGDGHGDGHSHDNQAYESDTTPPTSPTSPSHPDPTVYTATV